MPAWGGYKNGAIPASALVTLSGGGKAEPATAAAYETLAVKFKANFGKSLKVNSAYRTIAEQQNLLDHPQGQAIAAAGQSDHGWGTSLDLGSGVGTKGSQENKWVHDNGPALGFAPTGEGFKPQEFWHWSHTGGLGTVTATDAPQTGIGAFFAIGNQLSNPQFWQRLGIGALGVGLLGIAAFKLFSTSQVGQQVISSGVSTAKSAAKVAAVIPK